MYTFTYVPFTAQEVAFALGISDCDELTGIDIARDMLEGTVKFTREELKILAAYKGVSVTYLTEHNPAFWRYADYGCTPKKQAFCAAGMVMETRREVASKLLQRKLDAEFASEICGLPLTVIRKLM